MLTYAQHKWFDRVDQNGVIRYCGPRGFGRSSWEQAMGALVQKGLVILLVGRLPGYRVTALGEWYLRGVRGAEDVWRNHPWMRTMKWCGDVASVVSTAVGSSPQLEVVLAGARQQWLDLRAVRVHFDGKMFRRVG